MKWKLQILLIPSNYALFPTETISPEFFKKFIHLVSSDKSLEENYDSIKARYSKLYPDESPLIVEGYQDKQTYDLDPDFLVEEVFENGDTLRIIVKNAFSNSRLSETPPPISLTTSPDNGSPDDSNISLPPPTSINDTDHIIPKKRKAKSVNNKLLGKKRITSGMLNSPPQLDDLSEPEIDSEIENGKHDDAYIDDEDPTTSTPKKKSKSKPSISKKDVLNLINSKNKSDKRVDKEKSRMSESKRLSLMKSLSIEMNSDPHTTENVNRGTRAAKQAASIAILDEITPKSSTKSKSVTSSSTSLVKPSSKGSKTAKNSKTSGTSKAAKEKKSSLGLKDSTPILISNDDTSSPSPGGSKSETNSIIANKSHLQSEPIEIASDVEYDPESKLGSFYVKIKNFERHLDENIDPKTHLPKKMDPLPYTGSKLESEILDPRVELVLHRPKPKLESLLEKQKKVEREELQEKSVISININEELSGSDVSSPSPAISKPISTSITTITNENNEKQHPSESHDGSNGANIEVEGPETLQLVVSDSGSDKGGEGFRSPIPHEDTHEVEVSPVSSISSRTDGSLTAPSTASSVEQFVETSKESSESSTNFNPSFGSNITSTFGQPTSVSFDNPNPSSVNFNQGSSKTSLGEPAKLINDYTKKDSIGISSKISNASSTQTNSIFKENRTSGSTPSFKTTLVKSIFGGSARGSSLFKKSSSASMKNEHFRIRERALARQHVSPAKLMNNSRSFSSSEASSEDDNSELDGDRDRDRDSRKSRLVAAFPLRSDSKKHKSVTFSEETTSIPEDILGYHETKDDGIDSDPNAYAYTNNNSNGNGNGNGNSNSNSNGNSNSSNNSNSNGDGKTNTNSRAGGSIDRVIAPDAPKLSFAKFMESRKSELASESKSDEQKVGESIKKPVLSSLDDIDSIADVKDKESPSPIPNNTISNFLTRSFDSTNDDNDESTSEDDTINSSNEKFLHLKNVDGPLQS
ncbi:uncharacterized protein RJT21DRAFT_43554 [Scheffersomyces amazonensis]|uniref:uncharacterized protein n=1 Tax=Scheffersomyces amazonensis TaxID=1078765 RepID=UPI00315D38CC